MKDFFSIEIADHIATVTLLRTTMPPAFFGHCEEVFRWLSDEPEVRAIVVRSSAKSFSYGLDLPAAMADLGPHLGGGTAAPRMELRRLIRKLQGGFNAIAACPVPVIAAVHGHCIGGGLDLITACDIRLASRDATFSLRETRIAIVADLGSLQRLPRIMGQGHAREMAFTGKDISAERAQAMGLVNDVYDDKHALFEGAMRLAKEIAANSPLAVRGAKAMLDYGEGKTVADGLEYVAVWNSAYLASDDLGEAMASFMEKRPPAFKGK